MKEREEHPASNWFIEGGKDFCLTMSKLGVWIGIPLLVISMLSFVRVILLPIVLLAFAISALSFICYLILSLIEWQMYKEE